MYGKLENVTNLTEKMNFDTYDFKNEAPWETVRSETNGLKKFLAYQECYKTGRKFDCDNSNGTCTLADSIYDKLWGWQFKSRFSVNEKLKMRFGEKWNRFGPDTMNSYATTYRLALKHYEGRLEDLERNIELQKFAHLTHSVGNFTLIPFIIDSQRDKRSFNQYRGANFGRYFVYDYFDLSLQLIKENSTEEEFINYIDTFYLNDYVDNNYDVLPLFRRHGEYLLCGNLSLQNPQKFLPQNAEELDEYLRNVNQSIEARGKRMKEQLF